LAINRSRLNDLYPKQEWGKTKKVTLMNFGSFFSTTISITQVGTVSFKSTPSVSPPASRANNLYNVRPPTSENITGVWPGTEKYSFPVLFCITAFAPLCIWPPASTSDSSSTAYGLGQYSNSACNSNPP